MILPCRIHRTCNRHRGDSLPLALLLAVCLLAPLGEVDGQEAVSSTSEAAGIGWLPAVPLQITAGVDTGYDDNVTLSPSGKGSLFAAENIVLTYDRPGERTQFYLLGVGHFTQNFDVTGLNEKSGNVTMALTHNFSTRLSFYASVYGTYQNQPNFQSNVGPQNVVSPFFDTVDIFALTYHWSSRLSLVTSYTFERVQYFSSSNGNSQNGVQNTSAQNRIQNTFSEALQFSLTSRTVLVGEYRFETINYDTAPIDSTTHFVLAGINHNLTEHLIVHVLAGESFRSLENAGDSALPNFEGSLGYVRSNHSLNWLTSYGFEAPTTGGATTTKTLRTGLNLTYGLTSRLSSVAGVYYHRDENSGGTGTSSTGTQNSLDINLGLRYTINKHFTLHLDYNHTTQGSMGSIPGYSRNRYFGGLTYTY
jgi:putative beta-barrel porin BBP2